MPRVKTVKLTAILYTTPTLKSIDIVKTKLLSHKHKNGNANDNKNKRSERDNIKMHKMPRHNVKNNNSVKLKHLRRNKLYAMRVEPLPTEADKPVKKRKHFAKKFKNKDFKLACIVKFLLELDKLLHKLAKTIKFIKSMKTMGILHDKSNMRLTTLRVKSTTS